MYKTKICNFFTILFAVITAIVIFILINTGTLAIASFTTPLIIITAISTIFSISIIYIISLFNLFSNRKEPYCLCHDSKIIVISSIFTILLSLINLFAATVLGTLSGAILLGITFGIFVLSASSIICLIFCLSKYLCKNECICYNFCSNQEE